MYELAEIFDVAPDYILNYQEKSTFTNHFNNYDGNNGVNIMYQGCTADQVKTLEKQLKQSKEKLEVLNQISRLRGIRKISIYLVNLLSVALTGQ